MDRDNELGLAVFAVGVFVAIFFIAGLTQFTLNKLSYNDYIKEYAEEDKSLFGTYNEECKDLTDNNSRTIILEVDEKNMENANKAVVNYASNVNGRLVSVNNTTIPKSTFNSVVVFGPNSSGNISMGTGVTTGTKISSKNQYIIAVPTKAKLADNLQERLNQYLEYSKMGKSIVAGEEDSKEENSKQEVKTQKE